MAEIAQLRRKYNWTPELRELLREAYRGRNKRQITDGLDRLCRMTGWRRWVFKREASRLGITTSDHRRPWTAEEIALLEERAGAESTYALARAMGRSVYAVRARAQRNECSLRIREGYNIADLVRVFGVHNARAASWVKRGMFGPVQASGGLRVSDAAVARFLRKYPGEYELRRLDEDWFKGMIFGHMAGRAM